MHKTDPNYDKTMASTKECLLHNALKYINNVQLAIFKRKRLS